MLKTEVHSTYAERRQRLMEAAPDACFVFFGSHEVTRNSDVHYPFRQNSDFYYLTEFDEPGAALILAQGKSTLFVQERNPEKEIWDGECYGVERARDVFKVDQVVSMDGFYPELEKQLVGASELHYRLGDAGQSLRDSRVLQVLEQARIRRGKGSIGQLPVLDPTPVISRLRMIKEEFELTRIRKACSITAKAHALLLKRARVGMSEFEVEAEFQYVTQKAGARSMGYSPIFASGVNATILHYVKNDQTLKHGDLLLVDAGAEYEYYTADLTQTFPVSAEFSTEQKEVYQKVLEVNREITRMMKPGVTHHSLFQHSATMLTDALLSLGVLSGSLEENLKSRAYRPYYPHGLSHFLGLDVHDSGIYKVGNQEWELKAGMLLTNEPGLYFRDRGSKYFGIGVRIEDDILITENGSENLTSEIPREVDEIQELRSIANQ